MNRGPDAPFGNAPSTAQRSAQHAGHGHTAPSCAQGPFTAQDASHIPTVLISLTREEPCAQSRGGASFAVPLGQRCPLCLPRPTPKAHQAAAGCAKAIHPATTQPALPRNALHGARRSTTGGCHPKNISKGDAPILRTRCALWRTVPQGEASHPAAGPSLSISPGSIPAHRAAAQSEQRENRAHLT